MAYQNDPATDRRISRLSLISSASTFYARTDDASPETVLAAAQLWEAWVYGESSQNGNGIVSLPAPAPEPVRVPVPLLPHHCADCGNPLTEVKFRTGRNWSIDQLEQNGISKYGRPLCKVHYFGKKA